MTEKTPVDPEIVDEMQEADGGRAGAGRAGWIVVGLAVGLGLAALVVRNPLGLELLEPVGTWLGGARAAASASEAVPGQLWSCGMHPNVVQEEPGTCPICRMDLTPVGATGDGGHAHGTVGEVYTCPMHPEVVQGEPGSCPICGMDLVATEAEEAEGSPQTAPASHEELWTCPMHPEVVQGEPGSCPICGMDLVRMDVGRSPTDATSPGGGRRILFYRNPMDPTVTSPVPMKDSMGMDYVPVYSDGVAEAAAEGPMVTLDAGTIQRMNVVAETVKRGDLTRKIRTVGYLGYDEERMVSVTTKYEGFVEKVHANYLGQRIRKGEPLFDVYSPELVQTQEELLSAVEFARALSDAPEEARRRAELLVEAARRRLRYWDISDDQIRRIEERGRPLRTLTVTSTAGGLVMKRMSGLEGLAIKPGMEVLHVADLSVLWLKVEVYEGQLAWLSPESSAHVTFTYFPGESFTGRVRYIEPEVQEKTRTVGVTLEIPNPDARLRAGMYATVTFEPVIRRDVVLIPTEAILRTGERDVVVVDLGEGRFAPREVTLGHSGEGLVQVTEGLTPGERVVTSSQFLIDSESSLREAILKMVAQRKKG